MEKIERFIKHYKVDVMEPTTIDTPLNDILNAPITKDEVIYSLSKLKNNKASGIDGIPAEIFKYSGGIIDESLAILFNIIFNEGVYPSQWCEGLINPIHKKSSHSNPENYRKISIVPSLGT